MITKPQDFKLTHVRVNGITQSHEIQKAMFAMGFRWAHSSGVRKLYEFPIKGFILVDKHCRMWHCAGSYVTDISGPTGGKSQLISVDQLLAFSKAFKEADKAKRKARRKEKQASKYLNWTPHCGNTRPAVIKDADEIDIKFRDGDECINENPHKHSNIWNATDNTDCDIVAWRYTVKPKATPKKEKVSFKEMVADIAQGATVSTEDAPANTNPKKQYGVQSIPLSMWSSLGSAYGALAFHNGALKYGKANYANTPVEASIYIDGAMRHLVSWAAGEEFDPADGVPNLGGVLANVAILLEARAAGMLIDDRAKQAGYLKERDALKEIVKHLNELHADKSPKHYTLG